MKENNISMRTNQSFTFDGENWSYDGTSLHYGMKNISETGGW